MKKRVLTIVVALCLVISLFPAAALAAPVSDNPAGTTVDEIAQDGSMATNSGKVITNNGDINKNNGSVDNNNGSISENNGTVGKNTKDVVSNEETGVVKENNGSVYKNYGKVEKNSDHIEDNYGTVENSSGSIQKNFGTVKNNTGTISFNYGTVENDEGFIYFNYYKLDLSGLDNAEVYPDNPDYIEDIGGVTYVSSSADLVVKAIQGYTLTDVPAITGDCDVADNKDGSYTITNISGDIKVVAKGEFVPTTDVTLSLESFGIKDVTELNEYQALVPGGANKIIEWSVIDDGGTGTCMAPYSPALVWVGDKEGTVKLRATVNHGITEAEPFTKDFTVKVVDNITPMYDSFTGVKDAKDIDELKAAVDDFYNYVEKFSNLNEDQMKIFADKMGLSEEDAYSEVMDAWITANITVSLYNLSEEFAETKDEETANVFIDYYGFVFLAEEFESPSIQKYIEDMIPDIHERYEKAVKFLAGEDIEDDDKQDDKDEYDGPKTGDRENLALMIILMIASIAAIAVCLTVYKKRTN